MTAADLLAAVRAAQGYRSNYALARALGFSDNSVQRWNTGANTPDDATAARLAELAGFDPDMVVAAMHAQRSHDPDERARWQRIAQRLATPAAVALCAILALWTTWGGGDGPALAGAASDGLWIAGFTPYTLARIAAAGALAWLALDLARRVPRWGVRMQPAGAVPMAG